ncbi:MAG: hypothetical protein E5X90_23020, partial [Mesorhizobium sp.]
MAINISGLETMNFNSRETVTHFVSGCRRRSAAMRPQFSFVRPCRQSRGFRGVLEMIIKKAILAVLMTAALAGCETQT